MWNGGYALYNSGEDTSAAIEAFQRAISLDNTLASAHAGMAGIMASEHRYEEALSWYSKALASEPDNNSWHVARAHMARASGDISLATNLFLDAIELFPEFAPAHYGIALVYRQLDEPKKAVKAIESALSLSSSPNLEYYLRAGEIYEWTGDFEKALAVYQRAYDLDPSSEPAYSGIMRVNEKIKG